MRRTATGFTMVELLIVVVVLAILTAVAAPNLADMIRAQRVKTASFDLFSSLSFARSEAIKRNVSVTLTPNGGWESGWTVKDANNTLLRDQASLGSISITGPASLIFTGSGRLSSATMPQFAISGAGVGTAQQRCIKVDLSGRAV